MQELSTLKTLNIPLSEYSKLNSTQIQLAEFVDDLGMLAIENENNRNNYLKIGALGSRLLNLLTQDLNINDNNINIESKADIPPPPSVHVIMPPLETKTISPVVEDTNNNNDEHSSILNEIDNLEF